MGNRLDKIRWVFMVLIISAVMAPHAVYANPAPSQDGADNPSDWAVEIIDKAKDIDLVPEKILEEYRSSITREQFSELAVNLYKALDGKEDNTPAENPFTDTQNSKVLTAYRLGIVKGKGDGLFDPDNTVTREEISVMLYRTLQAAKPEYDYSNSIDHVFADQRDISSWSSLSSSSFYSFGPRLITARSD